MQHRARCNLFSHASQASVAFVIAFAFAMQSTAALIEADFLAPGDKLLTQDTVTGLEWLDVPLTSGESYNSVAGDFGGFVSAGFRVATDSQVAMLVSNAGVPFQDGAFHSETAQIAAVTLLHTLLGLTLSDSFSNGVSGIVDYDIVDATLNGTVFIQLTATPALGRVGHFTGFPKNVSVNANTGTFLVRPIPEPSTAMLIGLGLAGLAIRTRPMA